MTPAHRTTVAIPLHASSRWFDVIDANVTRLAGHAHLVVSDPTGLDDTLARLRNRHQHVAGIEWRTTPTTPGWVAHCNALLDEATTDYVMWLPHDDEIGPEWIHLAEGELDRDSNAMLVVGQIVPIGEGVEFLFNPAFSLPDPEERVAAALADVVSGRARTLGLLYRSVFRRTGAARLPESEWADVPWAIEMLAVGHAVQMDARYGKRWHPGSVSASWSSMLVSPGFRSRHIADAVSRVGARAPALLAQAWESELTPIALRRMALETEVRALREARSWRITAPFRWLATRLRSSRLGGQGRHDRGK